MIYIVSNILFSDQGVLRVRK